MKKQAKKAIRELEAAISKLPNAPKSFVYVDLWHSAQLLYGQGNYSLAYAICLETVRSISCQI